MIVWITHVKVGHRQTPYKQQRPSRNGGAFLFGILSIAYCWVLLEIQSSSKYPKGDADPLRAKARAESSARRAELCSGCSQIILAPPHMAHVQARKRSFREGRIIFR